MGAGVFLAARPYVPVGQGYVANTYVSFMATDGLNGTQTLAHIHGPATPTTTAGVLVNLPIAPHAYNLFTTTAAVAGNITAGTTYVNVHSSVVGSGEVRGTLVQVIPPPSPTPRPSGATATAASTVVAAAATAVALLAALRRE
jgi:hypothetical protein